MTSTVLVVARGYPSFDIPGRGSFVADHVLALRGAGIETVVASFETLALRGPEATRAERVTHAETAWARAVADPIALTATPRFGAPGVPVARLPVVRTWGAMDGSEVPEMAARHAAPLLAFGRALATRFAAEGRSIGVIHAHNGLPDGLAAMTLAAELGVPLVITEHDSTLPRRLGNPAAAGRYRELLGTARVVAVSQALADRAADALVVPGSRTAALHGVIPNPVPLERFPLAVDGVRDDDELLWVGARTPHKGIETLLRAVALVRERGYAVHLRAIGPASEEDEARWSGLATDLGIGGSVTLEPAAQREAVAAAMRRAGLFVHPSPFETFGVVAAEALASGLPVAATPSGGVEAIVGSDGACGEIAADVGPDALADAIIRLRDRLSRIDRAALRATIAERFAPDVVAARTLELYADAAGTFRRDPVTARPDPKPAGRQPDDGSHPIRAALLIAGHATARSRMVALPTGGLPVRPVTAPVVEPPSAVRRLAGRLTGRRPTVDRRALLLDDVRTAWAALDTEAAAGRVVIVPADVDDLETAVAAVGPVATDHLAPGSLRWLADRQDDSVEAVRG